MKYLTKVRAMGMILGETNNGRIFSVQFTKKNGEHRNMLCRRGVSKGVNGNGARYNAISKALLHVYDMHKGVWRSINFETINQISLNGHQYRVI